MPAASDSGAPLATATTLASSRSASPGSYRSSGGETARLDWGDKEPAVLAVYQVVLVAQARLRSNFRAMPPRCILLNTYGTPRK